MGACCSNQANYNPDKAIDNNTATEPIIKGNTAIEAVHSHDVDVRPVPLLGENNETTFQKVDVSDTSSDIDTKALDKMMKTDDDDENDDIDDEVEEENDDDLEEDEKN
ncbi:hypothetical protein TRFO_07699 [Tritrichomonas foetus]|uniref:Uncharacterized protein n=1 Tax=Tritrichomonas foetus TaxID=1144522 RepID=A0A1J4JQJ6_9EUKA|nr:hypothetical protein TRFO_07699 [Tritrichomonas foetus]|eukprot:OHT01026.1 hypothetical protein TRFO_07699 [Tritrichomonas foetus]